MNKYFVFQAVSLSVQQETSNLGPGSAPSKLHVSQVPPMAVKAPHQVPVQPEKKSSRSILTNSRYKRN